VRNPIRGATDLVVLHDADRVAGKEKPSEYEHRVPVEERVRVVNPVHARRRERRRQNPGQHLGRAPFKFSYFRVFHENYPDVSIK
jgi:hypothetical protein